MSLTTEDDIKRTVREQYGAVARQDKNAPIACCGPGPSISAQLGYSSDDLQSEAAAGNLGLGCGNPVALASLRPGQTVLDLGSGAGFDAFLAADKVGDKGQVIGVDMTHDMLEKARGHAREAGRTNTSFRLGEIEHLPVPDDTVDVIMSNCVVNLSTDKPQVLREAFRVLKPGGRLAISDVVALQPIPEQLRQEAAAYVGCVSGAAEVSEIERWLEDAGFEQVRVHVNPRSAEFIREWFPDKGAENYVASASIEAVKPNAARRSAPAAETGDTREPASSGPPAETPAAACCLPACCS